uniref:Pentacotripeptide-repeat region of PRORP domain-containing protein n=1 Tax=Grammatophora oceanica TaxID=210454 RepID=A0A7S1Y3L4_9STRA|mmetsp:Transcript_25055/g.36708  ORF Transcript_25055/g.36708 Transcript_25055/m.36708 type:complete len:774 (+) Transcript_25055:285-2606(+)
MIRRLYLVVIVSIGLFLNRVSGFLLQPESRESRPTSCKLHVLTPPRSRSDVAPKSAAMKSKRQKSKRKVHIIKKFSRRKPKDVTIQDPELFALFGSDAFADDPIGLEDKRRDALSRISINLNKLSTILTTWSRSNVSDADDRCYRVLERLRNGDENGRFRVNRSVYYAVINAFARRGKIQQAEQLREEMTQYGLSPNGATYVALWDAYVNSGRLEEAEVIIHEFIGNSDVVATPRQIIGMFTKTIGAWATQAEDEGAADECRRLLYDLRHVGHCVGDPLIRPSLATYTAVIDAHAKRGRAADAEAILVEMLHESEPFEPSIVPINAMMSGWSKSHAMDGANQCKNWMQTVKTMSASKPDLKPDANTYTALIEAYSKRKQPRLAEQYLTEMIQEAGVRPKTIRPFSMVMNAYAKSRDPHGATKCRRLTQQLRKLARDTGNNRLRPNLITYTTTIDAFARRGMAMPAEKELRDLLDDKSIDDPTVVPFNSCLNAWAKSKRSDAPERCQRLLNEMMGLSKRRYPSLLPNAVTFTCVLEACRKRCRGEVAEKVLNQMLEAIPPNEDSVRAFSMTLQAFSSSNSKEAPEECRRLLNKMLDLSKDSAFYAPNAITYTIVIKAFAKRGMVETAEELLVEMLHQPNIQLVNVYPFNSVLSGVGKSNVQDAPDRCERILNLMEQHKVVPDFVTFTTLLVVYAGRDMAEEAESILRQLQGHPSIKPNAITYSTVADAWAKSNATNAKDRHRRILDEMQRELAKGDKQFVADVSHISKMAARTS